MLSNWIKYYNVLLTWSALYTSLVSLEVLLLSKAHWIVSSDQRSIKMSVASLLHNLPRFFDAISFFPRKSTRFWRLKSSFSTPEPSHSWSVRAQRLSPRACTNTGTPEHRNTGTPEHRNTPEHPGTPRNTEFDGVVLFFHYGPCQKLNIDVICLPTHNERAESSL